MAHPVTRDPDRTRTERGSVFGPVFSPRIVILSWTLLLAVVVGHGFISGRGALAGPGGGSGVARDLPFPPGTRPVDPGGPGDLHISSRGFRKTVDFYEKILARRGLLHRAIPIFEYRGTVVARFLSQHASTRWAALHVFKTRGVTMIYIVPRAP